MEPRVIYQRILDETDWTELERRVYVALTVHPAGLNRAQLIAICFGESVKAGATTNNNSRDRRIRAAIARLRQRMVPIISGSGAAGYRMDTSADSRRAILNELISRRNKLNDLINRTAKMYNLPTEFPEPENAFQESLL
jgi:hypothetical protein